MREKSFFFFIGERRPQFLNKVSRSFLFLAITDTPERRKRFEAFVHFHCITAWCSRWYSVSASKRGKRERVGSGAGSFAKSSASPERRLESQSKARMVVLGGDGRGAFDHRLRCKCEGIRTGMQVSPHMERGLGWVISEQGESKNDLDVTSRRSESVESTSCCGLKQGNSDDTPAAESWESVSLGSESDSSSELASPSVERSRYKAGLRHPCVDEDKFVELLASTLARIAEQNGPEKLDEIGSLFLGKNIPKIKLVDYIKRMVRYLNEWKPKREGETIGVGVRTMVVAMLYIDRLCQQVEGFKIVPANVHRLCMTSFLMAVKFCEDIPFHNKFWSKVGGVPLKELNALESHFCSRIGFDFSVNDYEFYQTYRALGRFASVT